MWIWLTLLGCSALFGGGDEPTPGDATSPPDEVVEEAPRRGKAGKTKRKKGKKGGIKDGAHQLEISYRGGRRGAIVHVPASIANGGGKAPAIVMHHGGHGANGMQAAKLWKEQVEKDFILIFPDGQTVEKKAGWMPVNGELDYNVRFVEALLDEALKRFPIDEDRVFAAGWSSGAQQTMRLACLSSDRFQAFSVVSQNMEFDTRDACAAADYTPRPMQFIIGDSDPKNPWEGRGPEDSHSSPGRIGIQETIDFFVKKNGCKATAKPKKLRGAKVLERRYDTCRHGEIRWLLVEGGTHAWPGGTQGVKDLSATEESVTFFRAHGL